MSDTEEEEGTFDKEAEKEKLREQLRREEESRRTTQHMSELLLKGATMTNKHCDDCGDPLFRYEGREFCPTCAREGNREGAGVDGAVEGDDAERATGADDAADTAGTGDIDRVPAGTAGEPAGERQSTATGRSTGRPDATSPSPPAPEGRADLPEDVGAARDALVRKLVTLARQAEATDDVGRSRELLAAAREAAEALAAIEGIGG